MKETISGMTLNEAFKLRQSEVIALLDQVKARVSKADPDFDDVTWGDVGSLHKIGKDLIDTVEFLG